MGFKRCRFSTLFIPVQDVQSPGDMFGDTFGRTIEPIFPRLNFVTSETKPLFDYLEVLKGESFNKILTLELIKTQQAGVL